MLSIINYSLCLIPSGHLLSRFSWFMAQRVLLMWATSYLLSGYLKSLWCPWLWGFCIWWPLGSFSLLWAGSTASTWSLPGQHSPGGRSKREDMHFKDFDHSLWIIMPKQRSKQLGKWKVAIFCQLVLSILAAWQCRLLGYLSPPLLACFLIIVMNDLSFSIWKQCSIGSFS